MIHKDCYISKKAKIGVGTVVWEGVNIRENARIGMNCVIAKGVYVDKNIEIGNKVKIQNYASIFTQTIIEDSVFVGPYVCFSNDKYPRSTNRLGELKRSSEWKPGKTIVKYGASIGAGSIILPDIIIEEYVMIGAGSIVTKNIPKNALVFGNPARIKGYVCKCGELISKGTRSPKFLLCKECKEL